MRRLLAGGARAVASGARATGPWPAARVLTACAALAVALAVALWTAAAGHQLGGLLASSSVTGLGTLAVALLRARTRLLGSSLVLLGAPAALVTAGGRAAGAATLGAALVVVLELARWSAEQRVHVPGRARQWRRCLHLVAVVGAGWLAGIAVVGVASGRLALATWQPVAAAMAALVVAATVAAAARARA